MGYAFSDGKESHLKICHLKIWLELDTSLWNWLKQTILLMSDFSMPALGNENDARAFKKDVIKKTSAFQIGNISQKAF